MTPILSPLGIYPVLHPRWATLAAIDLESGDILWQVPFVTLELMAPWPFYHFIDASVGMGGPMVAISGLIFIAAASDGYIRAFDTELGDELWKAKLPTTGNAVPMSYTYSNDQYVLIAAR